MNSVAKYNMRTVADAIEDYIVDNALANGLKLPPSREIAARYAVSEKTADRALNHLESKGMIRRVQGSGSFVQSNRPRLLRQKIGCFVWNMPLEMPELDRAAYGVFSELLCAKFREKEYEFEFFAENVNDKEKCHLGKENLARFDVVVCSAGMRDFVRDCRVPVILIGDDCLHSGNWHQVYYDYLPGFHQALSVLRQRGYTNFFIAAAEEDETAQHRIDAICVAAQELGIGREHLHIYCGAGRIVRSQLLAGVDCAEFFHRNMPERCAILSCGDFITYGMYDYFRRVALRPGRDFPLISYDNMERYIDNPELKLGISGITHPINEYINAVCAMLGHLRTNVNNGTFYFNCAVPAKELIYRESFIKTEDKK